MRNIKDLQDAQYVLKQHDDTLTNLQTKDQDYNGRRITNAGDSQSPQDYVTRAELNEATASIPPLITGKNIVITGTFTINGNSYTKLVFKNGLLVDWQV